MYDTILGQRTRDRANAGPIFLVYRVVFSKLGTYVKQKYVLTESN